jgi:hypothetical protein
VGSATSPLTQSGRPRPGVPLRWGSTARRLSAVLAVPTATDWGPAAANSPAHRRSRRARVRCRSARASRPCHWSAHRRVSNSLGTAWRCAAPSTSGQIASRSSPESRALAEPRGADTKLVGCQPLSSYGHCWAAIPLLPRATKWALTAPVVTDRRIVEQAVRVSHVQSTWAVPSAMRRAVAL